MAALKDLCKARGLKVAHEGVPDGTQPQPLMPRRPCGWWWDQVGGVKADLVARLEAFAGPTEAADAIVASPSATCVITSLVVAPTARQRGVVGPPFPPRYSPSQQPLPIAPPLA